MSQIYSKTNKSLSSVSNALRILNCFTRENSERRVTDISLELGIGKSTVSRLLTTLLNEGYVRKNNETRKYELGLRILTLHNTLMFNLEIIKEARPILKNLANETLEAVQIAELEDLNVIYVDQIKSIHPTKILAHIGRVNPVHCTSSGKLLLAYQNQDKIDDILKNEFKKYTKYTITNPNILLKELKEIKEKGYCISVNEFIENVISISAPIVDVHKNIIAAVSVVGPTQRINGKKISNFTNKVIEAGKEMSRRINY